MTDNKEQLVEDLRRMRREAGYTQQELANLLGVARETVIAIEKKKPGTLKTLELNLIKQWWDACDSKANASTMQNFKQGLINFFGF